jgi:hypothetical protein
MPRKKNFLKEVFLDFSRTLIGRKLRFRREISKESRQVSKTCRLFAVSIRIICRKRSFRPSKVFGVQGDFFKNPPAGVWGRAPSFSPHRSLPIVPFLPVTKKVPSP